MTLLKPLLAVAITCWAGPVAAQPYSTVGWAALASDRSAAAVGDTLTVMVYEATQASSTAQTSARKGLRLAGAVSLDDRADKADGRLDSSYDGGAQSGRTDRLVAAISVAVREVLPNGDLYVEGEQLLRVDGDQRRIRVAGRVRRADISSGNTVLSSRMADADISYAGKGFMTRSSRPGLLSRVLTGFGIF